jgi:hypothetical protein
MDSLSGAPPPPTVTRVTVSPGPTDTLTLGAAMQLVAVATDSGGRVIPGRSVGWAVGSGTSVTVSASGLVTGRAAGIATVTATISGVLGAATIVVKAPPPPPPVLTNQLVIWPATLTPTAGFSHVFAAILRDSTGAVTAGVHADWSTSDTLVAKVDAFGTARFLAAGPVTLTARVGTLAATANITVVAPRPPVQVVILGLPIWTGQYEFFPFDSTGKPAAHVTVWVQVP